jgi:outer membrane murein-binding lipoprotein Lpp
MKTSKLSLLMIAVVLSTGCATNSDIDNLQSQISGLRANVIAAENRSDELNRKLDRIFRKSIMK